MVIVAKNSGTDYMREIGSSPDRRQNHTVPSLGSLSCLSFLSFSMISEMIR